MNEYSLKFSQNRQILNFKRIVLKKVAKYGIYMHYSDSHCGGSQANKRHGVSFLIKITGSQIVFQFFKYPFGEAIFSKNVRLKKKSFSQI